MIINSQNKRISAPLQVVNAIKQAIQKGELKVGDRLPNETELSAMIGVGRSSFREGMRLLTAYGVVEVRQGEGTFIIDRFGEQAFEFLGFMPNKNNISHLIQLRRVIETGCVPEVLENFTKEDMDTLERLASALSPERTPEQNVEVDIQFHKMIVRCTQNPVIEKIYGLMFDMLFSVTNQSLYRPGVAELTRTAHLYIVDSFRTGNLEQSITAVAAHLHTVKEQVEAMGYTSPRDQQL